MAGITPITTRTGIALRGRATIAAARPAAVEVAAIEAALPVVVDPVVALAAATRVAATQVVVIIIMIHRLLLPPYLTTRVGAQAVERAEVIAKRRRRYIAIRRESTNQRS
jgi:hypothetical protein